MVAVCALISMTEVPTSGASAITVSVMSAITVAPIACVASTNCGKVRVPMASSPVTWSNARQSIRGLSGDPSKGSIASDPALSAASEVFPEIQACGFNASNAIACNNSSGVQRFVRSGSNAERNAAMVPAGNPAKFALPAAARSNTAIIGFVPNTGSPVAANASTLATDHQSLISSDSAPSMISGAMNPGVPITNPVRVT